MTHHPVSFAIHGGAGDMPDRDHGYADHLAALQAIGVSTRQALADGADAIDAVELAVRQLEDCELFNAGRGAVLNADGDAELDASIMRGDGACGAVAGVRRPRNPIGLARAVMDDGHHVMLVGPNADQACDRFGVDTAPPDYFVVNDRLRQLDRARERSAIMLDHDEPLGTVGAVARDARGGLAAATSTGGMTNKAPGRVGDSGIIGAGTWASDASCAISSTGHGESFVRVNAAAQIHWRMLLGHEPMTAAAELVIDQIVACGGMGGLIGIDRDGLVCLPMSTRGMFRAWAELDGPVQAAVFR